MKKIQLRIIVEGVVQGVGFRYSTMQKARKLEIAGNVKNLSNGNLEINAVGFPDALKKLCLWCWEGPSYAKVSQVTTEATEKSIKSNTFSIY